MEVYERTTFIILPQKCWTISAQLYELHRDHHVRQPPAIATTSDRVRMVFASLTAADEDP